MAEHAKIWCGASSSECFSWRNELSEETRQSLEIMERKRCELGDGFNKWLDEQIEIRASEKNI